MSSTTPACSIVLPIYNERENLEPLLEEIRTAMEPTGWSYEVLAVDDASTDGGGEVLRRWAAADGRVRVLRHRRNFGQSAAFATGFREARGGVVVTLDADRQNDPADIPRMLGMLEGGVAAVLGVRHRREDSTVRRWSSRVANWYRDVVTGVRVADAGCAMRVMRREALRELPVFNGLHRFLPTLLLYQGYRVVEVGIHHRPRTAGRSKYGVSNRLWRGLRDCLAMRWYRARAIPGERVNMEGGSGE